MVDASARSYLYVPGNAADKLAGALRRGADAVIVDLEDAVPAAAKAQARDLTAAALTVGPLRPGSADQPTQLYVRVNADTLAPDIAAVAAHGLQGFVIPKASTELLAQADAAATTAEHRLGLPPGTFTLLALVESALGVLTAPAIATAPRVSRLGIGEADLIGELRLRPGPDRAELAPIRAQIVLASAAAGIAAPIAPAETRLGAQVDLAASTATLLAAGFRARTAIHPGQVPVINEVFTPSEQEVAAARAALATLGERGVAVDERGNMLDAAVVRQAREVLARARHSA